VATTVLIDQNALASQHDPLAMRAAPARSMAHAEASLDRDFAVAHQAAEQRRCTTLDELVVGASAESFGLSPRRPDRSRPRGRQLDEGADGGWLAPGTATVLPA
jgi:hypothetical protein